MTPTAIQLRLETHLIRRRNGCWEYNGPHCEGQPYVRVTEDDGRKHMLPAKRLAAHFYLEHDLDSRKQIYQTCKNGSCCNPEHFSIGKRPN